MRGARTLPQLIGYTCDVIMSLISIGFAILGAYEAKTDDWGILVLLLVMISTNVVTGIWMSIRLSPKTIKLTQNRTLREELYLANIDPNKYLWNHFRMPLIMSALPSIITVPIVFWSLLAYSEIDLSDPDGFFATLLLGGFYLTPLAGAILLFRTIETQCRVRKALLPPVGRAVVNGLVGGGYPAILLSLVWLTSVLDWNIGVGMIFLIVPAMIFTIVWPFIQINRAAREFYSFVNE